ncbi:anti-sigma factor family protein [Flavilitoribacter nigricans]|uniref:Tetratricopeptide repeat protein n=1 Tax=Flavilitoribacter nigricans (strain ATCC 23147 / DSM 23189 / NBRC 102662 / NCIMB 1420 / SS-2) TaxID=1122177 RepID=A0A2D0N0Z5_FLAN2|nr:hypothetical protein [Flavilitoribacter nigricans]PHN02201.1 hypothetical protein CRP01_33240 [Flavilitoribacter nigricans DSM 23189 = NBRC 102662]
MNEQQAIQIDRYLSGEMSEEERSGFERAVEQSAELAAELSLQRDMEAAFREPEVEDLEEKLAMITGKTTKVRSIQTRPWRWIGLAASVAIAVGIALWMLLPFSQSLTAEELYAAHIDLPSSLEKNLAARSADPDSNEPENLVSQVLQEVDKLYQEGAYQGAAAVIADNREALLQSSPDTYYYLYGILSLQQSEIQSATEALSQVQSGVYGESADWYLTLARLRIEGKTDAVRSKFEQFTNYPNDHLVTAKKVLSSW